jgi:hypothetical protein
MLEVYLAMTDGLGERTQMLLDACDDTPRRLERRQAAETRIRRRLNSALLAMSLGLGVVSEWESVEID